MGPGQLSFTSRTCLSFILGSLGGSGWCGWWEGRGRSGRQAALKRVALGSPLEECGAELDCKADSLWAQGQCHEELIQPCVQSASLMCNKGPPALWHIPHFLREAVSNVAGRILVWNLLLEAQAIHTDTLTPRVASVRSEEESQVVWGWIHSTGARLRVCCYFCLNNHTNYSYGALGSRLSAQWAWSLLTLSTTQWDGYYYFTHAADEKTELWRSEVTRNWWSQD